jgi:hypothetical protein
MTDTAVATPDLAASTWRASAPHVRKALSWIKKRGSVNADDLVAWDRDHGRRLFDWDDPHAAEDWRRHQALLFLNRFRQMFEGMRVRAFIHIHADESAGIEESAYFGVEAITQHPGMRAQVIDDITRRMRMLASELKLWKLTPAEQAALFSRLADAMNAQQEAA